MSDRVEIFPTPRGKWRWRVFEGKQEYESKPTWDSRGECLSAVLKSGRQIPVVLLRKDGSVHGELWAPRTPGDPLEALLEPAGENSRPGD